MVARKLSKARGWAVHRSLSRATSTVSVIQGLMSTKVARTGRHARVKQRALLVRASGPGTDERVFTTQQRSVVGGEQGTWQEARPGRTASRDGGRR
jgi:hypothetical protein